MKKLNYFLLPACLVLGVGILFAFVKTSQNYLSDYLTENSKDLIGQKIDLKALSKILQDQRVGEPQQEILLVFWSTTCTPCLQELPSLEEKKNRLVIAINTDRKEHRADAERAFKILAPKFRFFGDELEVLQKNFKIKFVPTHITISSEGLIENIQVGSL